MDGWLRMAAAGSILFAGAFALWARRAGGRVAAAARREAAGAVERLERERERTRRLKAQVEMLSAIREIGLIANGDVSFERILGDVLKVIEDLVESVEIAVFLKDDPPSGGAGTGGLVPRVVRRAGRTTFFGARAVDANALTPALSRGEREDVEEPDPAFADEAYRQRRLLRRMERGDVEVATLLYGDAEIAGVIAARVPARGKSEEDLRELEGVLESLTKHVALAIRKPTLYDRAVSDGLTRLYTKRHFQAELERYVAASRRTRAPLSLVLFDIDHFKGVNDAHGHLTGDLVLAEVAATIRRTIREYDSAYRYGGEEMAVIAPGAGKEQARALAERVRRAVEDSRSFRTDKGRTIRVTLSAGVAEFSETGTKAPNDLVAAADGALYEAKTLGRNLVRAVADPAPVPAPAPVPVPVPVPSPARPRRRSRAASKRA